MKPVILDWGWWYDVIQCPDYIANDIRQYQMQFDKWLFDENSEHGYWVSYPDPAIESTDKVALSWDVEAFINWLNRFVVNENMNEKVSLIEFQSADRLSIDEMVKAGIPRIYG